VKGGGNMALKPLDIFKLLPKTNCKECGFPTCLAFAMQVAMGKIPLTKCPYVSEEAKEKLAKEAAPPIKTITIGKEGNQFKMGGETVLFRHEKTFYNPTGIGILISDDEDDEKIETKLKKAVEMEYERVGLKLKTEIIAVMDKGKGKFVDIVKKSYSTGKNLILISASAENIKKAVEVSKDIKPIIFITDKNKYSEIANVCKQNELPFVVEFSSIEEVKEEVNKVKNAGCENIVLFPSSKNIKDVFQNLVLLRRGAITNKISEFGYPVLTMPCFMTDNYLKEAIYSSIFIAKYGSVVILSDFYGETLFPLLVERLNIYTDPQKPLTTPEGVYEIGKVDENSPVYITTNFSLTYFIVSGEIANSKVPSYLLIQDTEGLSVLTAWAADKFNAETIAELVKKTKIGDKVSKKILIIPGVVAQILGELEEELPDMKIVLGPREAAHIPAFIKTFQENKPQ